MTLRAQQLDWQFGVVHNTLKATSTAMIGVGAVAGGVGMKVVTAGAAFEQAISAVGAVGLQTRDQIAPLEKLALQLGKSTVFTAKEVANAMEGMARAGFKNSEIMAGIPGVLDAAAASGLEIANVSDIVAGTLRGMGLAATDAGRVADVMSLASTRTKTSMGLLGESMEKVAATAKSLSIPFEQVVASVALLQNTGIDASTAGTAMSTMLTQLATPSKRVAAMLKQVGLSTKSFKDGAGNMLPFEQVLGKLSTAANKTGGNFDRVAFFTRLVGSEGLKAALNLSELADAGKLHDLTRALEGAAGSASKMATLRQDNLLGDWEQLTGAIDGITQSVYDLQSGPLRGLVQGWAQWIDAHDEQIVAGIEKFFVGTARNLPEIITWLERGGQALLVFYTASGAVKTVRMTAEGLQIASQAARGLGKSLIWSADKMRLFNIKAAAGKKGLAGLREGLNAGELSKSINGVQSKLGKAGLYGAAALVGYEFGSWLNDTLELDKKIVDIAAKITGLDEKIGPRQKKRGMGDQWVYANGSVYDKFGLVTPGTGPFKHATPALPPAMLPPSSPMFDMQADADASSSSSMPGPQIVTQSESQARQIASAIAMELEHRQTVNVNVTATEGTKAEVKKERPRGGSRLRVPSSGRPRE